MSFLSGQRYNGNAKDHPTVKAATLEVEMVQNLFNRLSDMCFSKCISTDFKSGEPNLGEQTCTDRCVFKYMEVNKKIGEAFQEFSQ